MTEREPGADGGRAAEVCVVVIGRNEGARLAASIASVRAVVPRVVYVDSGSSDGSPAVAAEAGAAVLALDPARPFSAARGRNEGFALAQERWPDAAYVQFIDGDCLLEAGWIETARAFLDREADVAMLCGNNREEHPDASRYNAICAIEWRGASGDVAACGGNAMVRAKAFAEASGFDAMIAAGEEPELCLRLRRAGWRVHRLDVPMTVHDADMHRFSEWWRRAERSGKAYLVGYAKHGRGAERYNAKPTARSVVWGGIMPTAFVLALVTWPPGAIVIAALHAAKFLRIGLRHRGKVARPFEYAAFMMTSNIAEFVGIVRTLPALLRERDRPHSPSGAKT